MYANTAPAAAGAATASQLRPQQQKQPADGAALEALKARVRKLGLGAAASDGAASDGAASDGSFIPAFRADDDSGAAAAAANEPLTLAMSPVAGAAAKASSPLAKPQAAAAPPAPAPAAVAPGAAPRAKLLALCPAVPPAMRRDVWCLADFQVVEKLYTGYASKGARGCSGRGEAGVCECMCAACTPAPGLPSCCRR